MPTYVYSCPVALHGEFNVFMASYPDEVPKTAPCSHKVVRGITTSDKSTVREVRCGRKSKYVVKPIAAAIVRGGTGARKRG